MAMIHLDEWLQTSQADAKIIMQVHDELVLEVVEKEVETVMKAVRKYMSEVVSLKVPLTVSIGHGSNWDEAQETST